MSKEVHLMAMKETEAKRAIGTSNVNRSRIVEFSKNLRPDTRSDQCTTTCCLASLKTTKKGISHVLGKRLERVALTLNIEWNLITKANRRHTIKTTATAEKGSIESQYTSTHTDTDCLIYEYVI